MQLVAPRSGETFPSFHINTSVHTGIVALFSHLPARMHVFENTGDWRLLVAGVLIAALLYPLYLIFLHPLNRYPGPFLAKVTDYWRFQNVLGRRSHLEMVAVHEKYGIVVRTGPNTLSISDPNYIPKIYRPGHGFLKVFNNLFLLCIMAPRPSDVAPTLVLTPPEFPERLLQSFPGLDGK